MQCEVVAIVPTYNEPDELRRTVSSLLSQGVQGLHVLVVNAGDALPTDIASQVEEVTVGADHYWTHCVQKGFDTVRESDCRYIYLTNADTYAMPGTLEALLKHAREHSKTVACAPAYIQEGEDVRLLYSHQDPMGFLLYGRLIRPWQLPSDAPTDPFEIVLTGGQGVMFPAEVAREFAMDAKRFPHYASDHDLWLTMRKAGWRLAVLPKTGVVNLRLLSAKQAHGWQKVARLWWRMTSELTPESWQIMWRLRRKHLGPVLGLFSAVVSFGLRWTVGLRKILRRT
ncbi:MAG TPA: glycosyltransferase family 2 protein [Fimbriimonadaceae bacterium]|nr:glycosyltransferase family 2 protein [Fimbriimonadaceae bacterium]